MQTLSDFVGGTGERFLDIFGFEFNDAIDVELAIAGFSGSTQVASLLPAFESLNITATLPGLKSSLLSSGSLESRSPMSSVLLTSDYSSVLSTTFHQNNISQVTVDLANPFTAGFEVTQIISSVTSHGLALGTIQTATNFSAPGKSTTTSPPLDLNMKFDPATLFTLTRVLAIQAGLDPSPLDGMVALGGYSYVTATNADSTPVSRRSNIYTYEHSVG